MKILTKVTQCASVLCICYLLSSCEGRREVENTEEVTVVTKDEPDTARLVRSGKTAEEQLEEFRAWLNEQTEKGDTAIKKEWPKVQDELRRRNAQLEQNFDSLSDKSQEEYRRLQARYERWENQQERRQQQPLDPKKLSEWQSLLLREYSNINKIEANNIREAYLTFMGVVRTKRRNWTQDDWDYVDHIYSQLNQRRRQIENQITTGDNLKIRSLQAEYLALEGSADTQSLLRSTDKDR
ncbi:hypothetical protein ACSX1A_09485 [Pontibacter sp. MBLB2868]|uniref:hypothetical protein n=1 Tax=Pontibacter sp. MBLB2868 TaxID=3451555 RepID=UPI003F750A02